MGNPNRQPPGVSTGGQYAKKNHTEVDISLTPVDLSKVDVVCHACGQTIPGDAYLDHDQHCNDDSDDDTRFDDEAPFAYPGRVGQNFEDQIAKEVELAERNGTNPFSDVSEPSWSSLSIRFGSRHAQSLFERFHGDLDQATFAGRQQWEEVTQDPAVLQRLVSEDVVPEDFASPDDNRRFWAQHVRGDLVIDGKLTSNAYDLSHHGVPVRDGVRRVVGAPAAVKTGNETTPWSQASPEEQISYIDGFAAGAEAVEEARFRERSLSGTYDPVVQWERFALRDRGPSKFVGDSSSALAARRDGWNRALDVARFEDDVAVGRLSPEVEVEVSYGDAVGGTIKLSGVTKVESPGYNDFIGHVAPGQRRYNRDGETRDWTGGAQVRFSADSFIRGVA